MRRCLVPKFGTAPNVDGELTAAQNRPEVLGKRTILFSSNTELEFGVRGSSIADPVTISRVLEKAEHESIPYCVRLDGVGGKSHDVPGNDCQPCAAVDPSDGPFHS